MPDIIAESLDVLRPYLSEALFAPGILPGLWDASHTLAPLPSLRIGLECRLGPAEPQVDLQQCFTVRDGEIAQLAEHIGAIIASATNRDPAWGRLSEYCGAGRSPVSTQPPDITEIWLEHDILEEGNPTAPAVFLGLDPDAADRDTATSAIEDALAALQGQALSPEVRANVRRCTEQAQAENAFISHVGAMLSRNVDAVRVNVKRLPSDRIVPFLERVCWPGSRDDIAPLINRLFGMVDGITVCLDVGERIYPTLGLECFVNGQPGREPRWAGFLAHLVREGLCTPEKRDGLMEWPGEIYPTSADALWPAALIIDSLLHGADRFNYLARRLNHVKLSYHPKRPLAAKAYLGYGRLWLSREPADEPQRARASGSAAAVVPPLADTIDKAVAFVVVAQSAEGAWRDYPTLAGGSDEWVTGYVGALLAAVPGEVPRQAARKAWRMLERRRGPQSAWGYNLSLPIDADSTVWGLRLAQAVAPDDSDRIRYAHRFIDKLTLNDGGVTAYRERGFAFVFDTYPFLRPADGSLAGWCSTSHACVTAAVAAFGDERPLGYLRGAQRASGAWTSYWWSDDEYATSLAAQALKKWGTAADAARLQAAVAWASGRIGATGAVVTGDGESAFATAWCVLLLTFAEDRAQYEDTLHRAVRWLQRNQRADGSWAPSARLRIPSSDTIDPHDPASAAMVFLDKAGVFTTATVLYALNAAGDGSRETGRT